MIKFNVQNNYNKHNPHDGYAKFVQVYPFQSIQDIVDGEFVSTEKLSESIFYTPLKNMAFSVFPYLKDLLFWGKQS